MNNINFNCKICNNEKDFENSRKLNTHFSKFHRGQTIEDYMAKYFFNESIPICVCGECDEKVKWNIEGNEWRKFVAGHTKSFSSEKQPDLTKEEWSEINKRGAETTKERHGENFHKEISDLAWGKINKDEESRKEYIDKVSIKSKEFWESEKGIEEKNNLIERTKTLHKEGVIDCFISEEKFNERVNEIFLSRNIKIISNYSFYREHGGQNAQLEINCLKCNSAQFSSMWMLLFFQWEICDVCKKKKYSIEEKEVINFIKLLEPNLIENSRNIIKPKELDGFIEDKKFAIEYNGLFWHNENYVGKNHHILKTEMCETRGIELFHIFSDEWRDKREILKSMIFHKLKNSTNIIFARKCKILEIGNVEANDFFNKNHISGSVNCSKVFGLIYNNKLISALSLRKPKKANIFKDAIEIARFSSELYHHIPGGFSKLLKVAEDWSKAQGYKKIVSYADRRFSNGNVYEKNGFTKIKKTKINYWYTDGINRFSRFKFKPKNGKSEEEIAEENSVYKIYGCGNYLYEKLI